QENPELIDKAVEEILRYESPEQRTSFRIATQSLRVGDYCLEPGQQFGVIIGAANRDEAEFPNADRFDIQRSPNRHLAFGGGLHDCLGKHLARLEARVALGMMINRYPRLQLLSDKPDWRRNSFFRGLKSLPARLGE
ncbi:MAG: cytochrome P450, partial [Porticoccaceae bacterium]|nr:cytochrome P450 [Porticoccaceae bacterium]